MVHIVSLKFCGCAGGLALSLRKSITSATVLGMILSMAQASYRVAADWMDSRVEGCDGPVGLCSSSTGDFL